jgi:hypothetical protein
MRHNFKVSFFKVHNRCSSEYVDYKLLIFSHTDLQAVHSPIVIRDGNPCGLNTISGIRPVSVYGKSSCGQR